MGCVTSHHSPPCVRPVHGATGQHTLRGGGAGGTTAHEGTTHSASWCCTASSPTPGGGGRSTRTHHSCGYGLFPRSPMLRSAHLHTNLSTPCPAHWRHLHINLSTHCCPLPRWGGGAQVVYSSGAAGNQAGRRVLNTKHTGTGTAAQTKRGVRLKPEPPSPLQASRRPVWGGTHARTPHSDRYHLQAHSGCHCLPLGTGGGAAGSSADSSY